MSLIDTYAQNHVDLLKRNDYIDPALYKQYGVKSGLRNEDGKGVLAGLTNISRIVSEKIIDGRKQPCDGELWYRGHRIPTSIFTAARSIICWMCRRRSLRRFLPSRVSSAGPRTGWKS